MKDNTAYIESLQRRHRQLEEEIQKLQRQPASCSIQLRDKKAQKLKIKDEIRDLGQFNTNGQCETERRGVFPAQETDAEEPEPVVMFGGKSSCPSLMGEPDPNFWAA